MALSTSRGFEEKFRLHFTQGIFELASLARCLLQVQKGPRIYAELREHSTRAFKELAEAGALTEQELEKVHLRSLGIMALRSKMAEEQKRRKEHLDACNTRLAELVTLRKENRKNFLMTQKRKMNMETEQRLAELEGEQHRDVRDVALWSMLVPVVGTLIGGAVAIKAHGDIKKAERRATSAEDMVHHFKREKEKYYQEAEKYTKLLKEQESRIQENQRKMEEIEEEKRKLVKFQEETLDLQEALRRCVHFVGTLASKVKAAEITSRYTLVYESLQNHLEDMRKHMVPSLIWKENIEAEGLAILSSHPFQE